MEPVMLKNRIVWLPITWAFVLLLRPAGAQTRPASGLYQITSGDYTECCGFGGSLSSSLPNENQGFVRLTFDPQSHVATMTLLGKDRQTVFSIVSCPSAGSIDFTFDGFVAADGTVIFHADPTPPPDQTYWHYTVSNLAAGLRIDGTLVSHRGVCMDLPDQFTHSNVVAVLAPGIDLIERDGNSLRFHFTGQPLYDYTVEFTDSLSPASWQALARYRAKLGPIDVVVTNSFTNAQMRFFRLRQDFCFCRD
jgi:hypothetical protein